MEQMGQIPGGCFLQACANSVWGTLCSTFSS